MTVYLIDEENHGSIGVAATREAAIDWLIKTDWITEVSDFWNDKEKDYVTVKELFGEHWKEELLKQNDLFFEGSFYFTSYELIE